MAALILTSFDETDPEFAARCDHCDEPFVQGHPYIYNPAGVALCVGCVAAYFDESWLEKGILEEDGECIECGAKPLVYDMPHVGRLCSDCMQDLNCLIARARRIERHLGD